MSVAGEIASWLIVLGGAGFIAVVFQMLTAMPAVRRLILTLPTYGFFLRAVPPRERQRLRALLLRVADEGDSVGASSILSIVASARSDQRWHENALQTADISERLLRRTGIVLVDQIRYPGEVRRIRSFLRVALREATLLAEFEPAGVAIDDVQAFPRFVTALSGAVVLGDASETRARVFDHVTVVDRRRPDAPHVASRCDCSDVLGPGDYDGPVLDVLSVDRVSHPSSPRFGLVLQTADSCYASTESFDTGHGCKHIPLGASRPASDEFAIRRAGDRWRSWGVQRLGRRTNLLTAYTLIRTSDDLLVLAQRSERSRNGLSVLSLSAGGVVEFDDTGENRFDVDWAGSPDVRGAVVRETAEELGIQLVDESVRAMCAVLVNSIGLDRSGRAEGQVLSTVIFAASCAMSFDEVVEAQLSRSDPATGSFEVAHLESVPFGAEPAPLATWLADNAERVDQHLVVGISYVLMLRFGRERTTAALSDAFPDAPWWSSTRSSLGMRTTFPVGELIGEPTQDLLESAVPAWGSAWSSERSG